MHIFSKRQNCQLRPKQQGYILISLMVSLVILGLIALNEYMHLLKKQQLDRAETAATQIVSVANSIGDAIYEPMAMIEKTINMAIKVTVMSKLLLNRSRSWPSSQENQPKMIAARIATVLTRVVSISKRYLVVP